MRALSFLILLFSLATTAPSVEALTFRLDGNNVVGETMRIKTRYEDTFVGLGHVYGLGFRAMMNANPDVLPWVPGEGTEVILPLSFILPRHDGDKEQIILNLAEFRLYHFIPEKKMVRSYAVGIGREGWETPVTEGKVTSISKDPSWTPPESIRREHASYGDILPAVVAPGPDNPLGKYAVKLSMPGYLFHGTNKKIGFGMRVSHGCVRLYAGDIEELAMSVKPGVPVRIINEPVKAGWRKDRLYLEVHPQLEEDKGKPINYEMIVGEALGQRPNTAVNIDWDKVTEAARRKSGMPTDITAD